MIVNNVASYDDVNVFVAIELLGMISGLSHCSTKVVLVDWDGVVLFVLQNMNGFFAWFSGDKLKVKASTVAVNRKFIIGSTKFTGLLHSFKHSLVNLLLSATLTIGTIRYDIQNEGVVMWNQLEILIKLSGI